MMEDVVLKQMNFLNESMLMNLIEMNDWIGILMIEMKEKIDGSKQNKRIIRLIK